MLYRRFGKRALDLLLALPALVALLPVLGALALLVRARLGPPVLFRQDRPGLHGAPFRLMKFRTMIDARSADGRLRPHGERLTPFGEWLRSTSLDELPELWNVVKGEMSLVGPRPLLMRYLSHYSPEEFRRHSLRPGITGWAQIHGRNNQTWEDRFALDLWYVEHVSLSMDLRIMLRTPAKIVRREGIRRSNHASMPGFDTIRRRPTRPEHPDRTGTGIMGRR